MVALVHVETIGLGQIFIEDCKLFFFSFFCKNRERDLIHIYL